MTRVGRHAQTDIIDNRPEQQLLFWAVRYARLGWPVFPLQPRAKVPFPGTNGYKDATTDLERVAAWWHRHPDSNIGLATGVAFDVFDLDRYGTEDGQADSFDEIEAAGFLDTLKWVVEEETDLVVAKTGKGLHIYVQPTGAGNRAGFIPTCDWRGRGGYVVAPPSIHPSGEPYLWLCTVNGDLPPLPAAPDELATAAAGTRRTDKQPPAGPSADLIAFASIGLTGGTTPYGRAALDSACAQITEAPAGQRNHTLNAAAYSVWRLVAGGEIDETDAALELAAAAARCGLGGREAERTIASARSGLADPKTAPPTRLRKAS